MSEPVVQVLEDLDLAPREVRRERWITDQCDRQDATADEVSAGNAGDHVDQAVDAVILQRDPARAAATAARSRTGGSSPLQHDPGSAVEERGDVRDGREVVAAQIEVEYDDVRHRLRCQCTADVGKVAGHLVGRVLVNDLSDAPADQLVVVHHGDHTRPSPLSAWVCSSGKTDHDV